MAPFKYCAVFLILQLSKCEECVLDKTSVDTAYDKKLKNDLFCNYNSKIRPNRNGTTFINPFFVVRFFRFTQNEEIFSLYVWVVIQYHDQRLRWNPQDYDGLTQTRQIFYSLWTPYINLMNDMDMFLYKPYSFTPCEIKHYGKVSCTHKLLFQSECRTKLRNWPYDTQTCVLKFGEARENVVFTFNGSRGIAALGAEYGPGWNIIDYKTDEDPHGKVQMALTFVLERQALGLAAMILVPSILVSVLTLTTLLLDVKGYIRLYLACFSLLIHYSLLQTISEEIPKHSADSPSILMFVRDSLTINVSVVILTYIFGCLSKKEGPPPTWVMAVNEFVFKSKIKCIIWPRWDVKTASEEGKIVEDWIDFINIINSFSLMSFIFIYIILFAIYMPRPPS